MNTPPSRSPAQLARIVATLSTGFVVTQLDVTIVNVALARIGTDLHASVANLQWIVDAYTLAFAGLMLSAGALGDRFGARRLFVAGLGVFALASAACGVAGSAAMLIAARAVQGLGAAAMLPNSLALLNHACAHDPRLRARAVGWWTASGSIAIAAGPVIGGALIGVFGWRSIFLVNLPICVAGLAAALRWVDSPSTAAAAAIPTASTATPARSLDLPGQCLAIVALTLFTAGMGLAVPAMTTTVLASVERARAGTASAVLNTARQAGGAIGVATFGALASGIEADRIVAGLHTSARVSTALLLAAAALACAVRAHPRTPRARPPQLARTETR